MPHYLFEGENRAVRERYKPDYIWPVDGDLKKTEYIDTSDDGGRKIRNGDLDVGRPLKPDNIPTKAKRVYAYSFGISEFYQFNGVHFVSDRFRALVERFEPGVHQFFPMTVKQGVKDMGVLYYFNICNRIDGLAHEACVPPILPGDRMQKRAYTPSEKLVLSARKTAGVHVWRDMRIFHAYISDEFAAAMLAQNFDGAAASDRLEEVD